MKAQRPGAALTAVLLVCAAAAAAGLGGCKRAKAPIDGIGPWHVGKTTVADGYVCQPQKDGTTWCSNQPEMVIAEQRATVDLYFRGHDKTSKLEEILLALGSCNTEALDKWLTSKLGPAAENREKALVWPGKAATVVALLPAADGECRIHFVRPDAKDRIAQIVKESVQREDDDSSAAAPASTGSSGAAAHPAPASSQAAAPAAPAPAAPPASH